MARTDDMIGGLTREQLGYFRDQLLCWRSELRRGLMERRHHTSAENHADWADAAAFSTTSDMTWAERERALTQLREIDAALARIAAGTYGLCVESGESIGIQRLLVLPTARYSLETQMEIEKRRMSFR